MSNCVICDKECVGKTCSGACRAKLSRQSARAGRTVGQAHAPIIRTRTEGCKVAIPGDEDYVGVCEEVDGVWGVKKTESQGLESIEQPDLSQLPPNVSRPTGQRTTTTEEMGALQLGMKVSAYPRDTWTSSPEYCEAIYRLLNNSKEELEKQGQMIPVWKAAS